MRAFLVPDGVKGDLSTWPQDEDQLTACVRLVPSSVRLIVESSGGTRWASGNTPGTDDEYTVFRPDNVDDDEFDRIVNETERIV